MKKIYTAIFTLFLIFSCASQAFAEGNNNYGGMMGNQGNYGNVRTTAANDDIDWGWLGLLGLAGLVGLRGRDRSHQR